jgi:hypothetical protein
LVKAEDAIYGLVVQAEDIQKHAVALQRVAEDTLKKLPDASRETIGGVARQCIVEVAKTVSTDLLEASNEAKSAAAALRYTGILQGVFLLAAGMIIVGALYFVGEILFNRRVVELAELNSQIEAGQTELAELNSRYQAELTKRREQIEAELIDLKGQTEAERVTLNKLQSKTWRLELVNYSNGTRAIILPKGVKVDGTGTLVDGRAAVSVKP